MKLLHVIASMDPRHGGPCQGIRNLAPQVLAHGDSVEVVCLDDPQAEYLARESVRVHALGKGHGPWSYHPALLPWLKQNLPRFDAVILNGLWQYHGYALAKASRLNPNAPPYFIFPHGMLDPWFQRAPERRWKALRNWLYWKLIEHRVIRHAEALFFTCAEELRLARETFRPYQPQREINVGYGVTEPPAYHEGMATAFAEKCPGLNGRPYLLFLSRIHPKKGIDLLIKAYASVYGANAECRKQKAEIEGRKDQIHQPSTINHQPLQTPALVIAGPGLDTPYGREMQELAESLCQKPSTFNLQPSIPSPRWGEGQGEVSPAIFFPGMLTGDAKWGALYNAEAFVLPSHQENFGIAVAEALACGKPVLISDQVNIWREIEEDRAGLVGPDTLPGTDQVLRQWESLTPESKTAMSSAAKSCYAKRFSVVNSGQTLIATIKSLISQPEVAQSSLFSKSKVQ